MGYVDLRREDRARREDTWNRTARVGPGAVVALIGLALGWLVLLFLLRDGLLPTLVVLVLLLAALLVGHPTRHRNAKPHLGGEKQLLLALRDLGGITPVEAALETSLSVDEAEELLTRLADRGHLRLESRGNALVYVLPVHGTRQR